MKDPKRLGELLQQILPQQSDDIASILAITRRWRQLVGDQLAGYTKVSLIEKGVMVVDLAHPGFVQLFQMKEKQIMENIKKYAPELKVKRIRMRVVESLKKHYPVYKQEDEKEKENSKAKKNISAQEGKTLGQAFLEAIEDQEKEG